MSRPEVAKLSVIVPCFNEEAVIELTHARLKRTLMALASNGDLIFELVYVDDGSKDQTAAKLRQIVQLEPEVRVILLSRNFGHQAAVSAGLHHTSGDCAVIIDADLQDPPELISDMIQLWRAGNDVVYGQRSERLGEQRFKIETARAFYRGLNALSEIEIPLDTGDFRLIDRCVIDAIGQMPERDRYLRGMMAWAGFRQTGLKYRREPRAAGESKYPLIKMLRFALDGVLSFSLAPLRLAITLGFCIVLAAVIGIIHALLNRLLTDHWVSGWTMLFIAIMLMGGVQLMVLGMIGEYVGRIYMASKGRPLYLVKAKLGFHDHLL